MMSADKKPTARYVIWGLVLLLVVLHQDNWNWNSTTLVFGFIPVALFYHMCISAAASITWYMATKFAWPDDLEEQVLAEVADSGEQGGH